MYIPPLEFLAEILGRINIGTDRAIVVGVVRRPDTAATLQVQTGNLHASTPELGDFFRETNQQHKRSLLLALL